MKDTLISFETAKLAKEKGFEYDWNVDFNGFDDNLYCNKPTQSLLQKWLREEKKLFIQIDLGHDLDSVWYNFYVMKIEKTEEFEPMAMSEWAIYDYEECMEKALQEALKTAQQKQRT